MYPNDQLRGNLWTGILAASSKVRSVLVPTHAVTHPGHLITCYNPLLRIATQFDIVPHRMPHSSAQYTIARLNQARHNTPVNCVVLRWAVF